MARDRSTAPTRNPNAHAGWNRQTWFAAGVARVFRYHRGARRHDLVGRLDPRLARSAWAAARLFETRADQTSGGNRARNAQRRIEPPGFLPLPFSRARS